jgi:multidrug efflux pump subunit AcrB
LEQGPAFDAPVEVKIFGPDLAVLQKLGNEVRVLMTETRDVVHTRSDLTEMVPKLALHLDEYQTRMSGLSHKEIEQQLYSALEGLESGSLIEDTEEIPIRVRMEGGMRKDTGRISSFEFRPLTPRGRAQNATPLSALGEMNLSSEVASIPRIDGKRTNEIKAYITAGTLPHLVITEFKQKLGDSGFTLPPGYSMEYGGEAAKRNEAVGNLMSDIPLLIVLMIATLVASFRSFRVAFIIAVVGGLSIGLGLGALWAFRFPFGFMGVVGTMGLVGVAVNDAIVVMAGIRDNKSARAGDPEAIADIVIRRTRHIVATSLTTMAGFTPLVLGGGGFWPPVAITIAGGVGGATILALLFVPSFYLLFIGRGIPAAIDPTLEALKPTASPRPAKPGPRVHSRISPQRLRKSRTKAKKR